MFYQDEEPRETIWDIAGQPLEGRGWYYEGPDYSVGIFGYAFIHNDCKAWDDDKLFAALDQDNYLQDTLVGMRFIPYPGHREVELLVRIECPCCEEVTYTLSHDYIPDTRELQETYDYA